MNIERMYTIVLAPHVSEKSTIQGELNNQYTFKVARDATKPEIKTAIEGLFNVVVSKVQVLNAKGKTKRNFWIFKHWIYHIAESGERMIAMQSTGPEVFGTAT